MSMTNTFLGGGIIAAALQAVWMTVQPVPAPIAIHSLVYDAGHITQDRTVNAETKFTAIWAAEIVDATTGGVLAGCSGGGSWDYVPGRKAVRMTVQEWVGSSMCNITPGIYYPRATYKAGEFYISERGSIFEVTE